MTTVRIESASTHSFDLKHLVRSGGEELLQQLLEKAGYVKDEVWRARINEKQQASGMTPPISVVRFKSWGVYIRIKPGDNNTCHNVTLLTPSGYVSEEIFNKLRVVQKSFNRMWRKTGERPVVKTEESKVVVVPVVQASHNGRESVAVMEPPPKVETPDQLIEVLKSQERKEEPISGQQFLKSFDNVRRLLHEVYKLEGTPFESNQHYMQYLTRAVGQNLTGHAGGGIMRSLMGRELVERLRIGYKLTDKGREFIHELIPHHKEHHPHKKEPVKPVRQSVDRSKLLRQVGTIAHDLLGASERLKVINEEREKLQEAIRRLDTEEAEICAMLNGSEVEDILSRLLEIQKPAQDKS